MSIPSLLAELRSRDIQLWIEGDRLRCSAPNGVLTSELREQLSANKAALLDFLQHANALSSQQRAVVPIQPQGRRLPLFAVGGHSGNVLHYRVLARHLGAEQPFYGLQPPGSEGQGQPLESMEEIAAYFAEQLLAFRPQGPYLLAGFCSGGTVALELAQQLRRAGHAVGLVAMIASPHPHELGPLPKARRYLQEQWRRVRKHAPALLLPLSEQRRYLADALRRNQAHLAEQQHRREDPLLAQRARVEQATLTALARYRPTYYPGPIHLFLPAPEWTRAGGLATRWRGMAEQVVEHYGPAGSSSEDMLGEAHAPAFAEILRGCLDKDGLEWNPAEDDRKTG